MKTRGSPRRTPMIRRSCTMRRTFDGVEAEPVGDIGDGEPLVDQPVEGLCRIVHPTRVRISRITSAQFPRALSSCAVFGYVRILSLQSHRHHPFTSAPRGRHHVAPHATARRVATGTGATLALAVVGVTATAGAAHADDTYTVRTGDTVSHIATRTGTTVAAIARANALGGRVPDPDRPGADHPDGRAPPQHPRPRHPRPSRRSYTVVAGDTVSRIAARLRHDRRRRSSRPTGSTPAPSSASARR